MNILSIANSEVTKTQSLSQIDKIDGQDVKNQSPSSLISGQDAVDISEQGRDLSQTAQVDNVSAASGSQRSAIGITAVNDGQRTDTNANGAHNSFSGGKIGTGSSDSSSNSEDAIASLENKIKELQQEIIEIALQALIDDNAKKELAAKQAELTVLTAELAQLQKLNS